MFKNFKVLELASVLAGPGVGQFFAELGAEVIKVENLTTQGDVTRQWKVAGEDTDDRSAYFCCVNWGKKSVAVDLTSEAGKEIVKRLAAKADIVLVSYKPGDDEKLETDYKTLSAINPGLIYGRVTGYGYTNNRAGYDAVIQAESGFMFMNGEPGGPSLKMPVALIDVLAGHHLKEGLLLALLEKTKTGRGKEVEVSLIQAAIASLANQGSNWLVAKKLPQKQGSAHPNIAPYGEVFKTEDGKEILLAVGTDRQFHDLCRILNLEELSHSALYHSNQARITNRQSLNTLLKEKFAQRYAKVLLPALHAGKIPAGIIQNLQQVFDMPEAQEILLSSDGLTGIRNFISNFSMPHNHKTVPHILPPPKLGQHTSEILLNKLGMSPEEVKILRDTKIIH